MTQRIYWVPHTVCPFDCLHCHNDSRPDGVRCSPEVIDRIIANLPGHDSAYRLEEILVGGGDGLARDAHMEHLVRAFRRRFPQGPQATAAERSLSGHVILALQTAGPPLADARGALKTDLVERWLDLGVDYFQVASSDRFHRSRHPAYPWDALEESMRRLAIERSVEFRIYGKAVTRLVPSGRVLDRFADLEAMGAGLLTTQGYCAQGWETGSHFLTGQRLDYPRCSEVVIDPQGSVHPCCWYQLSPALFDLTQTTFDEGMRALRGDALCIAIDQGDLFGVAELAQIPRSRAERIRAALGDCGLCRLAGLALARRPDHAWIGVEPLSAHEAAFYAHRLEGEADWLASLGEPTDEGQSDRKGAIRADSGKHA